MYTGRPNTSHLMKLLTRRFYKIVGGWCMTTCSSIRGKECGHCRFMSENSSAELGLMFMFL